MNHLKNMATFPAYIKWLVTLLRRTSVVYTFEDPCCTESLAPLFMRQDFEIAVAILARSSRICSNKDGLTRYSSEAGLIKSPPKNLSLFSDSEQSAYDSLLKFSWNKSFCSYQEPLSTVAHKGNTKVCKQLRMF